MSRLILIDNWLESLGGHNYQYAVEILNAARDSGLEVALATAKSFEKSAGSISREWSCYPVFPYAWNRTHTIGVDGKRKVPIDVDGFPLSQDRNSNEPLARKWNRWLRPLKVWDRRRRIRAFANACKTLFGHLGFDSEDLIFLPSVSDFDFLGLVDFLRSHTETQNLHWHVQFHYDIFDGRPPDFERQEHRSICMQRQFSAALSLLKNHRLTFYATTPLIADQYNRLGVGVFHPLPYPISNGASARKSATASRPIRVSLAGAPRREKGKHELSSLIDQLRQRNLLAKDLQIWMQGDVTQIRRQLPELEKHRIVACNVDHSPEAEVAVVPHPLEREQYFQLISDTGIGLLPYNNARYHARASGVLIEMLSNGIPVIVTAGSWLALQLAEPNYQYLDQVFEREKMNAQKTSWPNDNQLKQDTSLPTEQITDNLAIQMRGRSQPIACTLAVPQGTKSMLIRFAWKETRPGYFVRMRTHQLNHTLEEITEPTHDVLNGRVENKYSSTFIPIEPQTSQIRIELSNAYHDDMITIGRPEMIFLQKSRQEIPAGAVGLIASDLKQIPNLLHEMLEHYEHYRTTAATHSTAWNFTHAPVRTIEILNQQRNSSSRLQGAA